MNDVCQFSFNSLVLKLGLIVDVYDNLYRGLPVHVSFDGLDIFSQLQESEYDKKVNLYVTVLNVLGQLSHDSAFALLMFTLQMVLFN